jgi:hypothetical protein
MVKSLSSAGQRAMPDPDQSLPPDPVVELYKQGVDRTLLRQNLRRSVDERILNLMDLQKLAEELRRAGQRSREQRR